MDWKYRISTVVLVVLYIAFIGSCTVSYKFNQASVDYSKVKTVSVDLFPNNSLMINPRLSSQFTEGLKNVFLEQTRLSLVTRNGDLHMEGEITDYRLSASSIQADATAEQTRLTITIKVRYTNSTDEEQNFESSFSAFREFSNSTSFTSVENQLVEEIIDELTENIFNRALANW